MDSGCNHACLARLGWLVSPPTLRVRTLPYPLRRSCCSAGDHRNSKEVCFGNKEPILTLSGVTVIEMYDRLATCPGLLREKGEQTVTQ
jgi:hypothetical protein